MKTSSEFRSDDAAWATNPAKATVALKATLNYESKLAGLEQYRVEAEKLQGESLKKPVKRKVKGKTRNVATK